MITRRAFVTGSTATLAATALTACGGGMEAYDEATARMRAALAGDADLREFVRFGTLAANGHNTQPWRFRLSETGAAILPDFSRRTPVVDPDDHHLFASLGCAAENFALAAAARGRPAGIRFDGTGDGGVAIDLARGRAVETDLFAAIPARQCTRSAYDGRAVPPAELRLLEQAARIDGIELMLVTDEARREQVLDYVIAGNSRQMDDPAFVAELKDWIRFNPAAALEALDGLPTAASGNPSLPTWFADMAFGILFTKDAENDKYAEHVRSSAGIAVFVSVRDDKAHWTAAGRSYQRFALQATALGIRHAHINQAVEVPEVRAAFTGWLGIGNRRPDLVIRFGYAPPLPMSPRRPVDAVLA